MPSVKIRQMPTVSERLRAGIMGRPVGVDREAKVLRGFVVAQLGPFKSEGRGQFDLQSLHNIVTLGNSMPQGLKSRFTHPTMSSDGLGKHLGRAKSFVLSTAKDARTNKPVAAVRADLHFNQTSLEPPPGGGTPYGEYVMKLVETDPDAISSSLDLTGGVDFFLETKNGELQKVDPNTLSGDETPIWRPTRLAATDIVDTGDAVDGLLSVDGLPLEQLWKGAEMLNEIFAGQSRDVVYNRLSAFVLRYLDWRFGEVEPLETPRLDKYRKMLERMAQK